MNLLLFLIIDLPECYLEETDKTKGLLISSRLIDKDITMFTIDGLRSRVGPSYACGGHYVHGWETESEFHMRLDSKTEHQEIVIHPSPNHSLFLVCQASSRVMSLPPQLASTLQQPNHPATRSLSLSLARAACQS